MRLGRSVEIKDSLIGCSCSVGPLSFLGDSLIGENSYLGALVRTSNERLDRGTIQLWLGDNKFDVGSKFGCLVGDNVKIGLQSSIMPGRIIPKDSILPPLLSSSLYASFLQMIEIIAEISCNHNKSIAILDALLDELFSSDDVTCIKLQAFQANSCTSKERRFTLDRGPWEGRCLHELMVEAETPLNLIEHASNRIRQNNKKLMLSVNAWDDLRLITHLCPDYVKLPSPESLDVFLAKKILSHGHNLVISTGVISDSELKEVANQLFPLINSDNSLTILHCVSEYPTDFTNVNLCRLESFKSIAPWASFGISDHTKGDHVPIGFRLWNYYA